MKNTTKNKRKRDQKSESLNLWSNYTTNSIYAGPWTNGRKGIWERIKWLKENERINNEMTEAEYTNTKR